LLRSNGVFMKNRDVIIKHVVIKNSKQLCAKALPREGMPSLTPNILTSDGEKYTYRQTLVNGEIQIETHSIHELVLNYTNGRPHATTTEFSYLIGKAPQTIRKIHSQSGACYGIRPLKLGNRLLWSAESIATLLCGGEDYV
jgi:hypothetical protein